MRACTERSTKGLLVDFHCAVLTEVVVKLSVLKSSRGNSAKSHKTEHPNETALLASIPLDRFQLPHQGQTLQLTLLYEVTALVAAIP